MEAINNRDEVDSLFDALFEGIVDDKAPPKSFQRQRIVSKRFFSTCWITNFPAWMALGLLSKGEKPPAMDVCVYKNFTSC